MATAFRPIGSASCTHVRCGGEGWGVRGVRPLSGRGRGLSCRAHAHAGTLRAYAFHVAGIEERFGVTVVIT